MRGLLIIDTPDLPEGILGCTDGWSTIWLDSRMLAAERRVVLEHEQIHVERGHRGPCLVITERAIDREVARRLVSMRALGEAAAWSEHLVVIADELDVMPETVADRLHALTDAERRALDEHLAEAHWA